MDQIRISYGIHILIDMYHILKSIHLKEPTRNFQIQIDFERMNNYRNDVQSTHLENYKTLVTYIFRDLPNVQLDMKNETFPMIDWVSSTKCPYVTKNDIYLFANNNFRCILSPRSILNIKKKFICINTKIVNASIYFCHSKDPNYNFIAKYHSIKNKIFNELNKSEYYLILLGERGVSDCKEYNYHSENFGNYVIYNDIIKNIPKVIDETYSDSKDGYCLENWQKTCNYLNNSKFNIYLGNGGGIHLYSNFPITLQFGVTDRILKWLPKNNVQTTIHSIVNENTFLNKMIKLLNS